MSLIQIVCANCGAKYRLPENFQSASARCKGCGATIDVAGQRSAAAAPPPAAAATPKPTPTPKPAAKPMQPARPAPVQPERAGPIPAPGTTAKTGRRGIRGERTEHGDKADRPGRGRRGSREREPAKGLSKGVLIGSIVGLVAIVAVGIALAVGGGDEPATEQTAQTPPAAGTPDRASNTPAAPTAPAADATAKPGESAPAEAAQGGEAPPAEAAKPDAEKADTSKPAEAPKRVVSPDEIFDPKTLPEMPLAEDVTDDEKTSLQEWITAADEGGLPWIRAKAQLEKLGHKAIAPIVNRLRLVDYRNRTETMGAYELNQLLTKMLVVVNTGFKAVELGESPVEPEIADYNAQTVKAWQRAVDKFGTEEKFAAHQKAMRERQRERQRDR